MITPTVGRVCWYRPGRTDDIVRNRNEPLAAIMCAVWGDQDVNLTVFDANGMPHARTGVTLVQDGVTLGPDASFCEWMPYQLGQAQRTEAAEQEAQQRRTA